MPKKRIKPWLIIFLAVLGVFALLVLLAVCTSHGFIAVISNLLAA